MKNIHLLFALTRYPRGFGSNWFASPCLHRSLHAPAFINFPKGFWPLRFAGLTKRHSLLKSLASFSLWLAVRKVVILEKSLNTRYRWERQRKTRNIHSTMRKHCPNVCKLRPCLATESTNTARVRPIVTAALQRQYSQTELTFWIPYVCINYANHDRCWSILYKISRYIWPRSVGIHPCKCSLHIPARTFTNYKSPPTSRCSRWRYTIFDILTTPWRRATGICVPLVWITGGVVK
jgi:hypothetical protein